jgi:hypothetical protein
LSAIVIPPVIFVAPLVDVGLRVVAPLHLSPELIAADDADPELAQQVTQPLVLRLLLLLCHG